MKQVIVFKDMSTFGQIEPQTNNETMKFKKNLFMLNFLKFFLKLINFFVCKIFMIPFFWIKGAAEMDASAYFAAGS